MRLIDADNLRGRVCELFLCAEPGSEEERRFALVLGLIDSALTISPPPNAPLTLEQLREMDGEPVWVKSMISGWALVDSKVGYCKNAIGETASFERYGELWIAYRRRPEEDKHD